jgi:hypothetical protein
MVRTRGGQEARNIFGRRDVVGDGEIEQCIAEAVSPIRCQDRLDYGFDDLLIRLTPTYLPRCPGTVDRAENRTFLPAGLTQASKPYANGYESRPVRLVQELKILARQRHRRPIRTYLLCPRDPDEIRDVAYQIEMLRDDRVIIEQHLA